MVGTKLAQPETLGRSRSGIGRCFMLSGSLPEPVRRFGASRAGFLAEQVSLKYDVSSKEPGVWRPFGRPSSSGC